MFRQSTNPQFGHSKRAGCSGRLSNYIDPLLRNLHSRATHARRSILSNGIRCNKHRSINKVLSAKKSRHVPRNQWSSIYPSCPLVHTQRYARPSCGTWTLNNV
ncbi:hypothetical protein A0H81_10327 [Grifola frondosa]|uniref:Uncharacterized protein n=1 Tax=Grifola frondosa TaxID=5627 RepID=A0A1C7LZK8_GRIFR|nr:hypothetical protein A0H81_10327 [Grifola frondosa]